MLTTWLSKRHVHIRLAVFLEAGSEESGYVVGRSWHSIVL